MQYTGPEQDTPAEIAFLQILSNLIVLNTFVPISLYVRLGREVSLIPRSLPFSLGMRLAHTHVETRVFQTTEMSGYIK